MFKSSKCAYKQDLILTIAFAILAVIFILVSPLNQNPLRILFALPLIFFIPGYAFIAMMFPRKSDINGVERFTLSIALSIAISVFDGFVLSQTQWLFRPNSISISLLLITLIFTLLAYIARRRHPEEEQFTFSAHEFIELIRSEDDTNPEKDRVPPEITKALTIALVGSIIIASGMLVYAKVTQEKEHFTALYILGPDGKAENYPTNVSLGKNVSVTVGIENYEGQDVNYILQMRLEGKILETLNITLADKEKWEGELTYRPEQILPGKSKLEYALFKESTTGTPYRSVHLWIKHEYSKEDLQTLVENEEKEFQNIPAIENVDMEDDRGWIFKSTNTNIDGTYILNGTYIQEKGIFDSRAAIFEIPYEGILPGYSNQYYDMIQNINSDKKRTVIISVFVKDTYTSEIDENDETQFKQILVNNLLVWQDGIGGDEGWQHVHLPITLEEDNNLITLRTLLKGNSNVRPVDIVWDEVTLLPISELSPYVSEKGVLEFDLPQSQMGSLPLRVNSTSFEVQWNGTDIGSGIDYYLVEYSNDGLNWQPWLPEARQTSATFTGVNGNDYYFRTRARDNAGNWEPVHNTSDTNTTVDITDPEFTIDIFPNPSRGPVIVTVKAEEPLQNVNCLIIPDDSDFQYQQANIEMSPVDEINWSGTYLPETEKTHRIEVTATDLAYNYKTTIDQFYIDTSLEALKMEIHKEENDRDFEIKVIPSVALREDPEVRVRIDNTYVTVSNTEVEDYVYTYQTEVNRSIEGERAYIYVNAYTIESERLTLFDHFIINLSEE